MSGPGKSEALQWIRDAVQAGRYDEAFLDKKCRRCILCTILSVEGGAS